MTSGGVAIAASSPLFVFTGLGQASGVAAGIAFTNPALGACVTGRTGALLERRRLRRGARFVFAAPIPVLPAGDSRAC